MTLGDYPGTALVVSHDRDFLDRVATQIVAAEEDGHFGVYAGGYSDMLSQRRAPQEDEPRKEPRAGKSRPPRAKTAKMNFSEQHLLNTLPDRIEGLGKTIASLQAELSDPGLYARDAGKFAELSARLSEAQAAKAADEELWLALELKREDVEG